MTLTAEPWTTHDYIADPAPHSKRVLERFVMAGWQVIIFTCRPDCFAVQKWAEKHYPRLISGVNFNPEESWKSRRLIPKPYATIYIDDKAWPLRGHGPVNWLDVERDMVERGIFTPMPVSTAKPA
jgi:hypothetical protein